MKKGIISLIIIICGFVFVTGVFLKTDISRINDNGKDISFKLPALVKFAALREREESYKAWIADMTDVKDSDEVKIEKIFNQLKDFPRPSELKNFKENFPSKYEFRNIAQHEYQVLIKQQAEVGEQALNFCNLMTIAGWPASPVYQHSALVVVKTGPNDFLYFDFDNRKMIKSEKILDIYKKMCEEKLNELDRSSRSFLGRDYLHGYAQISWYRFQYTVLPWRRWKSEMRDYLTTEHPPAYLSE